MDNRENSAGAVLIRHAIWHSVNDSYLQATKTPSFAHSMDIVMSPILFLQVHLAVIHCANIAQRLNLPEGTLKVVKWRIGENSDD